MSMNTTRGGKQRGESKGAVSYTCPICGAENNKRHSLAVKGGRICRSHPQAAKVEAINAARLRTRQPAILVAVA